MVNRSKGTMTIDGERHRVVEVDGPAIRMNGNGSALTATDVQTLAQIVRTLRGGALIRAVRHHKSANLD